ncbi:MAG: zinc-dependent metalloprotease [Crocinitomicaceae bacterium]|nr:zinc-dependent metalloprotease [Crocinitomicaceae bacterium]
MKNTVTHSRILLRGILVFSLILNTHSTFAQKKTKKKDKEKTEAAVKKDGFKKISELTKNSSEFPGLFTVYQDSTSGDIKIAVSKDQIGKEYIYFSQIADGVTEVRGFRGNYKGSKVIKIEKYYNKIEFIQVNTSSYFDPENALSKAAEANMPDAIIASLEIEGTNKDETIYLLDGNSLFLTETFSQVKPPRFPGQSPMSFTLGNLDKNKTKINAIRSYPANTDIAVEYVYSKPSVLNGGSRAVTDGRNVSIKVYHSLIEMPDNDYQPLFDDPRVGYFTTQVTDMTSPKSANYRDLVHRWHLVKKDPEAELSEPVEPIVWWMENTTPENLRPIIKNAAEKWNIAFKEAGFKNAVVIKQQPDNADWDAGDIRYNVLRWTASPNPPFGGYGPSFVNPRTGQIMGADIMFEYRSVLGRLRAEAFFKAPNSNHSESEIQFTNCDQHTCEAAGYGSVNTAFAGLILQYIDGQEIENSQMINDYLHYLILHEIGHTLGLNHNMKASQLHNLKDVHNIEITSKVGVMASVMDYPSINVSKDRENQGQYFTKRPGPYDLWAIQFAYETGRTAEESKTLLARSTEPQLMFGNDADDMRAPGKAIDPRVNIYDLTSDAIEYGIERMELVKILASEMMDKHNNEGQSYDDHFIAYQSMMRQYRDAANTMSRYIGGVYVDRAFVGQEGGTKPYTPVALEKQKLALNSLSEYIFAPDAFDFSNEMYSYIQPQRRGFNFFMRSEDPKLHSQVLNIQSNVLNHILHPTTLQRIVDTKMYGNEYDLSAFMTDLNKSIFKEDIAGSVNTFRQNLQIKYTEMLIAMVVGKTEERYNNIAQSHAIYFLKEIKKMASNSSGDISSKAHKTHIITLIDNALKEIK